MNHLNNLQLSFKYKLGSYVYMRLDVDQTQRMVIERHDLIGGTKRYVVTDGQHESMCYEDELSSERDELRALNVVTTKEA